MNTKCPLNENSKVSYNNLMGPTPQSRENPTLTRPIARCYGNGHNYKVGKTKIRYASNHTQDPAGPLLSLIHISSLKHNQSNQFVSLQSPSTLEASCWQQVTESGP